VVKITHLMPVKDGARYLGKTLQAISENATEDDEIIVVNDGSTDETLNLLNRYSNKQSNLKVISTKGIGIVKSLNLGLTESTNTWIARYDVDDIYASERVAKQRALISHRTAAVFCDYELILENGQHTGVIPSAVDNLATIISLLFSQQTPHPGVIMNKNHVVDVGGYIDEDFPAEDLSLWLRISKYGELISSPEVLFKYRVSKISTSGSRQNEARNKKLHLLKHYGLPLNIIQQNFSELSQSFNDYTHLSFANERKLLLKRNIHELRRFYPDMTRISRFSYPIFALGHPLTFGKLAKQKLKRLAFRRL